MNKKFYNSRWMSLLVCLMAIVLPLVLWLSSLYYEDYKSKVYNDKQYNKACSYIKVGDNIEKVVRTLKANGITIHGPHLHRENSYYSCTWDYDEANTLHTFNECFGMPCFEYFFSVVIYYDKDNGKISEFSPYL